MSKKAEIRKGSSQKAYKAICKNSKLSLIILPLPWLTDKDGVIGQTDIFDQNRPKLKRVNLRRHMKLYAKLQNDKPGSRESWDD